MPDTGESFIRKLPFSMEAEQSVLGSVLIAPESFNDIAGIVRSDDFYLESIGICSLPCRISICKTAKSTS